MNRHLRGWANYFSRIPRAPYPC
ncbi:MAG: hypothetical protein IPF53_09325 [Blastocatellia bacterium]|nr:hypothetical protein [Blastocatellia bacterium]